MLCILTKVIKLFYLHCSHENPLEEKSSNTVSNKSENPKSFRK